MYDSYAKSFPLPLKAGSVGCLIEEKLLILVTKLWISVKIVTVYYFPRNYVMI